MKKFIIFDMDGIVFDTETMVIDSWILGTENENLKGFREVLIKCIGTTEVTTMEIFKEHYPTVDFDYYKPIVAEILQKKKDLGIPVKYYVREILENLKSDGYTLALASSTVEAKVRRQLTNADLIKYFDVIVGGDNVKQGKPAPDIFLLALEKLGCKEEGTIVIEDSINGVKAAMSAKCTPIMVPDLVSPPKEFKDVLVLENLEKVYQYIKMNK